MKVKEIHKIVYESRTEHNTKKRLQRDPHNARLQDLIVSLIIVLMPAERSQENETRKQSMEMTGKRKASGEEKGNYSTVGEMVMDNAAAMAAALGGARRAKRRFVGVRQRASGRWVAEIKDTIQKIRVWLGTYDTAEEAARAYDEAAYLLRGANTRTNLWPCSPSSHPKPALPSKIANLLLLRLKERNSSVCAASMASSLPGNVQGYEAGEREEMCFDDFFNMPEDCRNEINNSDTNSTTCSSTSTITTLSYGSISDCMLETLGSESDFAKTEDSDDLEAIHLDIEGIREEKKEKGLEEEEEIDMKGLMDFQFVDRLGLSSCDCSPFEIAEEMVEPLEQQENIYGDEPSMLSETMKRMKFERKFSASLYAFNGISECLRLKQYESEIMTSPPTNLTLSETTAPVKKMKRK